MTDTSSNKKRSPLSSADYYNGYSSYKSMR